MYKCGKLNLLIFTYYKQFGRTFEKYKTRLLSLIISIFWTMTFKRININKGKYKYFPLLTFTLISVDNEDYLLFLTTTCLIPIYFIKTAFR